MPRCSHTRVGSRALGSGGTESSMPFVLIWLVYFLCFSVLCLGIYYPPSLAAEILIVVRLRVFLMLCQLIYRTADCQPNIYICLEGLLLFQERLGSRNVLLTGLCFFHFAPTFVFFLAPLINGSFGVILKKTSDTVLFTKTRMGFADAQSGSVSARVFHCS